MNSREIENKNSQQLPVQNFAQQAYLDYAMYVILDRALPHIGDGLKPVQRRIIYAMSQLGLSATAKYKKSARTIGDVLGKFHPHGDVACYEAMVLMAQSFSYRYPLIDGQGNWGSVDDPKSFAAMRYTESRLSKYSDLLLSELTQGTVNWEPNFDGTLQEPKLLPSQVPNVLLNGASGIAVGMATDILPHNINEILKACIKLLKNPNTTLNKICEIVKAPDFPTNAEIITPKHEIDEIYKTGSGSIKMRAIYRIDKKQIIITALPYHLSVSRALEQIAQQMLIKKLPMVSDLRDESDYNNPVNIIIYLKKSNVDADSIMSHLFASTDLEKNYRANFNVIGLDGKPAVKNLLEIISEWLEYRKKTVRLRLENKLSVTNNRLHILEGLIIVYINIDEVIDIIRSYDDAKQRLIKKYNLSEIQVESILNIKLRQLAKLEEVILKKEQAELLKLQDSLMRLLTNSDAFDALIIDELQEILKNHSDTRNSPLVTREMSKVIEVSETIPKDNVTVILSKNGWVRVSKGHDINLDKISYRAGDEILRAVESQSNKKVIFLDSAGKAYTSNIYSLPSSRGHGEPLSSKFTITPGDTIVSSIVGEDNDHVILISSNGYGFYTQLIDLQSRNKTGKSIINLNGFNLVSPAVTNNIDNKILAILNNTGRLLCINLSDLPKLSKGKGNKLIKLSPSNKDEESVISIAVLSEKQILQVVAGKKILKLNKKDLNYYMGKRTQRGLLLPRGYQKANNMLVI